MKTFHLKARYVDDNVFIEYGRYHNGTPAIRLLGEIGDPIAVPTVCLSHINEVPAQGNVFIKNYSESEGLLPGLREAGIIGEPIREIKTGMVTIYECPFLLNLDDSRVRLI